MGSAEDTAGGTLAMVTPGGADGHAAVFVELGPGAGGVGTVKAGGIGAEGNAGGALHLIGGAGGGTLFGVFVDGTHLVEDFLHAVHIRDLLARVGVTFLPQVGVAEVKGIHADLFSQFVHADFEGEFGFRSAVAAEGSAVAVVRADGMAFATDVVQLVAEAHILGAADGQKVAEFGVRAVVAQPVRLEADQLASLLVGRHGESRPEGRTLAGVILLLGVVEVQVHRTSGSEGGNAEVGFHGRAELVAEGAAGGVGDHNEGLAKFDAEAVSDHEAVQMDADRLAVDNQLALVVDVSEAYVGLDGQVRLTLRVVFLADNSVFRIVEGSFRILALDLVADVVVVRGAGMDFDGVRSQGVRGVHVFGQLFEVNLDFVGSSAGMLFSIGADDGEGVAILEDLGVIQDGTIPAVALVLVREGDEAVDAVLALDVLGGKDSEDAGHLESFGGIDALDVGVRNLGLHEGEVQGVLRHHMRIIVAVFGSTGNLGNGGAAGHTGTPDAAVNRLVPGDGVGAQIAAHNSGGVHDGINDRLVARAAAHVVVLLEPVTHFLAGRLRIFLQQSISGNDEAGGAETTLSGAMEDPGLLQGMQHLGRAHAFNGHDFREVRDTFHFRDTGADNLAVEKDGTGTAGSLAAANLHAGDVQLITDHINQSVVVIDKDAMLNAVHDESFRLHEVTP